ncbi:hypothetical protein B4098_2746 [Heyndrickxia coagulans]|uniref:Uncharacterized protein n=1 Tax=Heyndrickxia coagulans TaxID=1398 RepID=A0A150KAK1_HEYCO|nr:hypothetical protein B4098_2746 [Heyndrickxia coagulans]
MDETGFLKEPGPFETSLSIPIVARRYLSPACPVGDKEIR